MSNKTESCEARIDEHLESRIETLTEAMEEEEHDPNELVLCVDKETVYKVHLSTGGPADFLSVYVDDNKDITRIDYHFQDWFDGAVRTLHGDDFDTAEAYCQNWLGIGEDW